MNRIRAALAFTMTGLMLIAVWRFPGVFELAPVAGNAVGLLGAALAAVPVLLLALTALATRFARGGDQTPGADCR
ncbi:MAG TPA: hypothetical protein PLP25_11745, partial [Candidatus Limiplasma sp.]|nr:hypothetical protein [Candidatus Limiplasma sp.]